MTFSSSSIPRERMKALRKVERSLGFKFRDRGILDQALTHPSFANEQAEKIIGDYEQLEFIGDAVLDLAVGHLLFRENPLESEGYLTRARADLVNKNRLAQLAGLFDLEETMRLGKGERLTRGWLKPSIQAATFEAVVGAMYLDGGYRRTFRVIERLMGPLVVQQKAELKDPRSLLQEWSQQKYHVAPTYTFLGVKGPGHERLFQVEVAIGEKQLAVAEGPSKKEASRRAAKQALDNIREESQM